MFSISLIPSISLKKTAFLFLNKLESPLPRNSQFISSLDEISQVFLNMKIFKIGKHICTRLLYLHLEIDVALCAKFGLDWDSCSGDEKKFKWGKHIFNVILLFHHYFLMGNGIIMSFIWADLNPFHQRMLLAKIGWNWTCGCGDITLLKIFNVLVLIFIISDNIFFWKGAFMVAYFCHHLSDNYVDLSGLYVDLSVIYVDLSDNYVDLSEKYLQN